MNVHDWAVVIGIRRYPDAAARPPWITNLNGPDNDADAVAEWLRQPSGGGLPANNVRLVRSADYREPEVGPRQQPIHDELNHIAELPDTAFEGQYTGRRLYLYVAGHGYAKQRNEAALVTADAKKANPSNILVTSWLEWFWKAARFKEFVLWADCCATRAPVAVFTPCGRTPVNALHAGAGRMFIAFAARFDQLAVEAKMDEDGKWHGVFTWALLKGLQGAAFGPEGAITSNSLRDYLTNNMKTFMTRDQLDSEHVAKEPDFGNVDPITFGQLDATPRFPVTLRFPAACIGKPATIVTNASRPPAASTTLAQTDWQLDLEVGAYAAFVPALGLVHPFTVTGGTANGIVTIP